VLTVAFMALSSVFAPPAAADERHHDGNDIQHVLLIMAGSTRTTPMLP
jgi:hypothetical protein